MIAEEEVVPETFDGEAVHRALEQILAGFENLREWPKIRNRVLQALGIRGGIEFLTYLLNNGAISRTTFIEEYPEIEDRNYYRIRELLEPYPYIFHSRGTLLFLEGLHGGLFQRSPRVGAASPQRVSSPP
jgi:hypothetical protein